MVAQFNRQELAGCSRVTVARPTRFESCPQIRIAIMAGRPVCTEHRIHAEERNRIDSRSTLRYAAPAKRRWERDIVRLLTLRKWVGTAFGTAWPVELALSADDAALFRPVGPLLIGAMQKRWEWKVT